MQVVNAYAKIENKFLRIDVDKWANIKPSDQEVGEVNKDNNISELEYEMVRSTKQREGKKGKGSKGKKGKE